MIAFLFPTFYLRCSSFISFFSWRCSKGFFLHYLVLFFFFLKETWEHPWSPRQWWCDVVMGGCRPRGAWSHSGPGTGGPVDATNAFVIQEVRPNEASHFNAPGEQGPPQHLLQQWVRWVRDLYLAESNREEVTFCSFELHVNKPFIIQI